MRKRTFRAPRAMRTRREQVGRRQGLRVCAVSTTGAYLAIVDTFVVSSDATDGVNAMKFMATIADPKTSLEFNKAKGSVPIRNDVDVSSLPAYQRQASESLWNTRS